MSILKSIGGVANGWAKFAVAILALGWFGVYALDQLRISSRGLPAEQSSVSRYDADMTTQPVREVVSATETEEEEGIDVGQSQATTTLGQVSGELWSGLLTLFGNSVTQLVLSFLAGTGIGLLSRPALSVANQRRKLSAARRRQLQYDQDRQLLAASHSAPTNAPRSPVVPSSAAAVEPLLSPHV